MIKENTIKKGDVLQVARIASIQAAKKCSELIPLCHPIMISSVSIDFKYPSEEEIEVLSTVESIDRTGVEMEALVSANIGVLTIYDMCKAVKKDMIIKDVILLKKTGGKSGDYSYPLNN
jgi:cyclic pyranopterin monophosphate synthase